MTCSASDVVTWSVPRESVEWVGPIVTTLIDRLTTLPVAQNVQIAVLVRGTRPQSSDWVSGIADPDGTPTIGYLTAAISDAEEFGIWARDTGTPETPVLEPWQVGFINRT